jgi:hypothetical protein
MSFKAEQPFFPYREPQQPAQTTVPPTARLLKVYFIGDGRYDGVMENSMAWPGRPAWSGTLAAEQRTELMRRLRMPADAAAAASWLTLFRDLSDPRPGTADVNFIRAPKQDELRPERETVAAVRKQEGRTSAAAWIVALLVACAAVAWIVFRRKR